MSLGDSGVPGVGKLGREFDKVPHGPNPAIACSCTVRELKTVLHFKVILFK